MARARQRSARQLGSFSSKRGASLRQPRLSRLFPAAPPPDSRARHSLNKFLSPFRSFLAAYMHLSASLRRAVALVGLLVPLPQVLATGQVPVYNNVIGAVPQADTRASVNRTVLAATQNVALSSSTTPGKLRVVENSGVCETTPGVYQASGYGDLTANQSLWSVYQFPLTMLSR